MLRSSVHHGLLLLLLLLLAACQALPWPGNTPSSAAQAADRAKLLVSTDGLLKVTPALLREAGLEVQSLDVDAIRLSSDGATVPALYAGNALYFYGQGPDSPYLAQRPYILHVGEPGLAVEQAAPVEGLTAVSDTVPQTLRLEENKLYISEARQAEGDDVWLWAKLPQQETFLTEVTLPALSEAPATLRLQARGVTHNRDVEGDHDVDVLVNEIPAGRIVWDGPVVHTAAIELPAGVLQEGINSLLLDNRPEGANFLDIMEVNWLELTYRAPAGAVDGRLSFTGEDAVVRLHGFNEAPYVFDVSDPGQPRLLDLTADSAGVVEVPAGRDRVIAAAAPQAIPAPVITAVRESDWRDSTHQADLLIVTTDELVGALQPLVDAREAAGLSVAVVPVAEIYDEFGAGATSPESIHRFVKHAYDEWARPRPRYLLLVGDATSDYRGYLGELPANHVPAPMVPVQFSGETVSDSRLADVDGDMQPDLAVGRWPVRSAAETEALVARTLAYEEAPAGARTLFATDGSEAVFSTIAQRLVDEGGLPAAENVQLDGPTAGEIASAWQDGPWLATYVGHGSIDRWGKEDILDLNTVADLRGASAPIVMQLTCLTGLFSHPEQTSLAEAMLAEEGGPVLIIAASSLTLSAHQEPFATALYQELQAPEIERIGDAFLAAKQSLDIESSIGLREISDTFALLGDPSARIARPAGR